MAFGTRADRRQCANTDDGPDHNLILEIKVMAVPIIPRLLRGRLYFPVADALFPTFGKAAAARSADLAHRLGIVETGGAA